MAGLIVTSLPFHRGLAIAIAIAMPVLSLEAEHTLDSVVPLQGHVLEPE